MAPGYIPSCTTQFPQTPRSWRSFWNYCVSHPSIHHEHQLSSTVFPNTSAAQIPHSAGHTQNTHGSWQIVMHTWLPILLVRLLSILQASTLREQYYQSQERVQILEVALEDIQRISQSSVDISERHRLIQGIVRNTLGK